MAVPLLIDTDMVIDDAIAVALALASNELDVRAIVGVGGSIGLNQVMTNVSRLLRALAPSSRPRVGRGLERKLAVSAARLELLGADGFGNSDLPADDTLVPDDFLTVYSDLIEAVPGELVILAIGPLTNLAAILKHSPDLAAKVKHVYICGGAIWTRDDEGAVAEFNFHHNPEAAAAVLASPLPMTVVPLDVTRFVTLDESHAGHLSASSCRAAQILGKMLAYPLEHGPDDSYGKFQMTDAVAAGSMLWPKLFLKTRMRLEVVIGGKEAGRSKPLLGGDKTRQIDLLTAVNAVDFQENLLESLCKETFVV